MKWKTLMTGGIVLSIAALAYEPLLVSAAVLLVIAAAVFEKENE